jgi:murein DD-endopeptidase MepM/ murein hydrolase activator NlpD
MAAGMDHTGFGLRVIIRHEDNRATLYAHLDSISVKFNQKVSKGDMIGLSGSTGNCSGPHLHFETRRKWNDELSCFNPELLPFD